MSIIPRSQTVLVTPGQNIPNQPLDNFVAQSLAVDNPTGQWFYLPNQQRWIAPYTLGTVLPLNSGVDGASSIQSGATLINIQSQTPVGGTSNPQAGQQATFIYSSEPGNVASGQSTTVSITNSQLDVTVTNSQINADITGASINLPTYEPTVQILSIAQNNVLLQNGANNIQTLTVPLGSVVKLEHIFLQVPKTTSAAQGYVEVDLLNASSTFIGVLARLDSVTTAKNSLVVPMSLQLMPGWQLRLIASNADTVAGAFNALVFCRQIA